MDIQLLIQHENALLLPAVTEGVALTLERKNTPGKLTFSAVQDDALQLGEGDAVRLTVDGTAMFYGFIFRLKRTEGETVEVTAYDQLYYLKNKDSFVGEGLTASELLAQLAADFQLNLGEVADTGYKLPVIDEQNQTLFDMISNALAETLTRTGQLYVLFDEGGKLCLKGIEALRLGLLIDAETGEGFTYESTLDEQTYSRVKLTFDNGKTGKREVFLAQDGEKLNRYGVLQYYEQLQTDVGAAAKAEAMLKLYGAPCRHLSIKNAFGDVRVRAGSGLMVQLQLGSETVSQWMIVESVKHSFKGDEHFMDLKLIGGDFVG